MGVKNVREATAAMSRMAALAEAASLRIVQRGEAVLNAAAKREFTAQHKAGTPTTSEPGSPPAVVTGTLRRSIRSSPPRVTSDGVRGRVYPTVIYSRIQELGGGFLPPRAYMGPARDKSKHALLAIAVQEWKKVRP